MKEKELSEVEETQSKWNKDDRISSKAFQNTNAEICSPKSVPK